MARMDHTACTHPRTPAGRAACRKNAVVTPSIAPDRNADLFKLPTTTLTPAELDAANTAMQLALEAHEAERGITPRNVDNQALLQQVLLAKRPKLTRAQLASPTIQSMLPRCTDKRGTCLANVCYCNG